ncbi:pyrroline-5-carboxylate reductase family protein [Pseudomonas fluorescens]|uniref:pyrroline-5-carboxylate reductase family protein n=1 Tax=Pseudomonas fluorescens TaxID=294 RepID=UPI001240BABF|nr:pyrroline-5-carboxylate reductase dimerization domain-containing protein [Pseudomonas fluorescens]
MNLGLHHLNHINYLFSEALSAAGAALGLSSELVNTLAAQTAFGAASLQTQPGADFVALRTAVTSPNGTTASAIATFEQNQALRHLIEAAARAAHRRSQELSKGV